jgi:alpha-tubulin suppressor-like RCC1 family protein
MRSPISDTTRQRRRRSPRILLVIAPFALMGLSPLLSPATPAGAATTPILSAGVTHTCALMPNSTVECWGYNHYGELGNGTTTDSSTPVTVTGLPPATEIAAGDFHTCAIDQASLAWCWGSNAFGALGNGKNNDKSTPVNVSPSMQFSSIAAGGLELNVGGGKSAPGDFTCAVLKGRGDVYCWGFNANGQLGDGSTTNSNVPQLVTGLPGPAVSVTAGGLHACAVLASGGVYCWGDNSDGQLGNNKTKQSAVPVQAQIAGATAVGAGTFHSCALLGSGGMDCWGDNNLGQVGNGSTTNSHVPVPVSGLAGSVQQIAVNGYHTCALVNAAATTEVECWGDDQDGALGDGHYGEPPVVAPEAVFGIAGSLASGQGVAPVDVAAGQDHTCAVVITGQAFCWGNNAKGQVGDGTLQRRALPTLVIGLTTGVQGLSEGDGTGCALESNLSVRCWGSDDGNDFAAHPTAQNVTALSSIASVAAGDSDACALSSAGTVQCWGQNTSGEVGNGTTTPAQAPATVTLSDKAGIIAEGSDVSCASMAKSRTLWCWGYNHDGELGNNTTTSTDTPTEVTTTLGVQISTADAHSCAVSTNGRAYCWGENDYGELGDGTTNGSDNPVKVKSLPATPVQVVAGGDFDGSTTSADFSCALLTTGDVYCFGVNETGELGNNTTTNSKTPVQVELSGPAKQIVAGGFGACALLMTGQVQCWGEGMFGQLGNGGNADSLKPVNVSGLSQVLQISSNGGALSTCALTASNTVLCWGDNTNDELGNGANGGQSNTPQTVQGL